MTELSTGVDRLMELVRTHPKIALADAAKQLDVPEKTIQAWADFLVEEHVLGIEYKFTTPYLYVHSDEKLKAVQEDDDDYTLKDFKEVFYAYARQKEMPQEKLPHLWREHLKSAAEQQKQYFLRECERRAMTDADELFEKYLEALLNGA